MTDPYIQHLEGEIEHYERELQNYIERGELTFSNVSHGKIIVLKRALYLYKKILENKGQ